MKQVPNVCKNEALLWSRQFKPKIELFVLKIAEIFITRPFDEYFQRWGFTNRSSKNLKKGIFFFFRFGPIAKENGKVNLLATSI